MRPLLFVTGHAPAYRVGAFACLHEHEDIEVALFGGRSRHGGAGFEGELPFPHRHVRQRELAGLAASRRYRAVVCPTGGRVAPGAVWIGTRRARLPLILWASLWAHPRSAAHAVSYLPLRRLYRTADAVVTYGPHVSAYVIARRAHNVHVAPQSVDNDFWREAVPAPAADLGTSSGVRFLFVGRPSPEKGLDVLLQAWRESGLAQGGAELVVVGSRAPAAAAGVRSIPAADPPRMREIYEACDVLVIPSIPTRTFREPWALVANEAMNRGLAVIATDAVGAAAGGLVSDGRNGIVLPAGDAAALSRALVRLADDGELRAGMGAAGSQDVLAYSHDAWAAGFSRALEQLGLSARVGSVE